MESLLTRLERLENLTFSSASSGSSVSVIGENNDQLIKRVHKCQQQWDAVLAQHRPIRDLLRKINSNNGLDSLLTLVPSLSTSLQAKAELLLISRNELKRLHQLSKQCMSLQSFAGAPPLSSSSADMDKYRVQLAELDMQKHHISDRIHRLSVTINQLLERYYKLIDLSSQMLLLLLSQK